MAIKTREEYYESLRKTHPTTYILGEKVGKPHDHPLIKHMVAGVAKTYDLANDAEGKNKLVTQSDLTGKDTSRFVKFYTSRQDLQDKIEMLKYLSHEIGTCYMRCTGMDAINAVGIETYNCDRKYKTNYNQRFLNWLKMIQENDFTVFSGVTDMKGDRLKRPSEQSDPDMYVHVVDRNDKGIVVRGAKIHQTGSLCAHWGLIVPTREMMEADKDYALCFALPVDAKGFIHVYGRGSMEARELEECDLGNAKYSKFCPMIIFDDVFIPWEHVFLFGEYEFAGDMVRQFGNFHRHSHGGCKCGVGDVLIGAAAAAAEYNGLKKVSHINTKLAEMTKIIYAMYGCSIAASVTAEPTSSGIYNVDPILSNTSKLFEGKDLAEVHRMMIEIAGGGVTDLPSDKDFANSEIGHFLTKYLKGADGFAAHDRVRILRLVEKLAFETRDIVSNIHGGGSPETHRMTLLRNIDIESKKKIAKKLAGIKT